MASEPSRDPEPSLDAVLGLGSNLGDRLANLRGAVARIASVATVVATSRVYETDAVGPPQPDYLNGAVRVLWHGTPDALLAACLEVEQAMGRVRTERWGPRTIDLDVLWIRGVVLEGPRLVVPHPHLQERAFALRPLYDVAPDATDPRTGAPFPRNDGDGAVRLTDLALG